MLQLACQLLYGSTDADGYEEYLDLYPRGSCPWHSGASFYSKNAYKMDSAKVYSEP